MDTFTSKRAVVVGGSGGIGAALSIKLAEAGASLVVHGGHDSDKFRRLMERIWRCSPQDTRHQHLIQEISSESLPRLHLSPLMESVRSADILCVAYGPFLQKSLLDTTPADWIDTTLLNYALPGICISGALPHMTGRRWGRILLFGGTLTHVVKGYRTNPAYGGAKTALCSLVKSVALAYSCQGVTCNAVLPGFTETEYQSPELMASLSKKMPCGAMISAETIAQTAINLMYTKEINGALLNVDGGWHP